MKTLKLIFILFLFTSFNIYAQFVEDFEDCSNGSICNQPGWTDWWGCSVNCCITCSDNYAHSGNYSGLISNNNTTNTILNLGNKIFGNWGLEFWMYIPQGREAYLNLQGVVPVNSGEWIVGNFYFNKDGDNPGVGFIDMNTSDTNDDFNFNYPEDQWFKIITNVNISTGMTLATWEFYVASCNVVPTGTPFVDGVGNTPNSLGGINFYSISTNNEFYLDDISYQNNFIDTTNETCFLTQLTTDNIESYPLGRHLNNYWSSWNNGIEQAGIVSNDFAHSGTKSMLITNNTETNCILKLNDKNSGKWHLEWWMYIPDNNNAYFDVLSGNIPNTNNRVTCSRYLNQINNNAYLCTNGTTDFTSENAFQTSQWFKVELNVDLTNGMENATFQEIVNDNIVIPKGTPFTLDNGTPSSFGMINFKANTTFGNYYLDDFKMEEVILNINDYHLNNITVTPNPTNYLITINNTSNIKKVTIYNLSGQQVYKQTSNHNTIDITDLNRGIYIIKINTHLSSITKKFIKK